MSGFHNRIFSNVQGRDLRRLLKILSASERAMLAADLETGVTRLDKLSRAQSAALLKVAPSYVETAKRATAEERARIAYGQINLSSLHNRHRHEPASDAKIERLVTKLGPDRVMHVLDRMLDRMTAPDLQAAE